MAVPVDFAGSNITIGPGRGTEDRVGPLRAFRSTSGEVLSRHKLSPAEIEQIVKSGDVWVSQMTFNHPLQPIMISGLPLMQLIDENGDVAGAYDPDDMTISNADLGALAVFETPDAL